MLDVERAGELLIGPIPPRGPTLADHFFAASSRGEESSAFKNASSLYKQWWEVIQRVIPSANERLKEAFSQGEIPDNIDPSSFDGDIMWKQTNWDPRNFVVVTPPHAGPGYVHQLRDLIWINW